jgi:hypothetical protein
MPLRMPWHPPIPHLTHLRAFSHSAPVHRDLGAKYRYRPPPPDTYLTASTIPVTSSIQAVPPPSSVDAAVEKIEGEPVGGRKAVVLPVMQPLHQEEVKVPKERGTEMVVAGVVVPPKPSPPESDGMFALFFSSRSPWLIVWYRMLHVRLRRMFPPS